jgi:hypothetical protein
MTNVSTIIRTRQFICLLGTLVALVVADGLLSQFLIGSGLGTESNPFIAGWVSDSNFLYMKLAGALLCALILWDVYKSRHRLAILASLVFVTLYTGIVYWNIIVFITTNA